MLHFYLHTATSAGAGGGDEDPQRNPYRLKSAHEADVPANQNPYQVEEEADHAPQAKRIKSNYHAEPCPFCQRSFKSSDALHEHIDCHTELSLCAMVLESAHEADQVEEADEALQAKRIKSNSEPCPICQIPFKSSRALGLHMRRHTKLSLGGTVLKSAHFPVEEADEALQAKSIKSSYKPCPICQIPFKSSRAVSLHMRCHTKLSKTSGAEGSCGGGVVRPIMCRECGADFATCRGLGEHLGLYYRKKECPGTRKIPSIETMYNTLNMIARERSELLHAENVNNNNNIVSNNHNHDRLARGFGILDLNLPPPQEEEEEEEQDIAGKD